MPFADYQGEEIHYRVLNEGDGPPVVWHHGLMGSSDTLLDTPVPETFKGKFEILALDSLGHGQSDKPDDPARYTRKNRAGNVAAVLDHAGYETTHYIGYSMGGWLGCAMARHQPHRLRSLIVAGYDPLNSVESMPPRTADEVFDFATDMFVRNGLPSPVPVILADEDLTRGIKHCWNALWEVEGARDDLTALKVPVWLICGGEDEFYPGALKLAGESGLPLLTLSGDHASATPALYERLDELDAYWRKAERA